VGHPIELDRVLGEEANFAGTSFLTLEKLNTLALWIGHCECCGGRTAGAWAGLGSFAYDDEGVPAQCTDIIKGGEFRGYLSNRETAHLVGLARSSGTMRTESWNRLPIIRMTNVSLLPGTWKLDDLIADTDDAILMETNRSWSIDDRRYQFQFSTEIGWEIKGGKRGPMLKNPSYSGITTSSGIPAMRSVMPTSGFCGALRIAGKANRCRRWVPGMVLHHRVFETFISRRPFKVMKPMSKSSRRAAAHGPKSAGLLAGERPAAHYRQVLRLAKSGRVAETEVHVDEVDDSLTRFAKNAIHQNVAERG